MLILRRSFLIIALGGVAACAGPRGLIDPTDVDELAKAFHDLGVRNDEAARAAALAYSHTNVLAKEYQITDPPLIHNTKVNMGLKPRGLCWHWAEDMEKRLAAERFETISLHRAIANAENPYRIDHSTVVASVNGAPMEAGIVLDPWRKGGELFWSLLSEDTRYNWRRQKDAHEIIRRRKLAEQAR